MLNWKINMINKKMAANLGLTPREYEVIASCPTPEAFQEFLQNMPYKKEKYGQETYWSFRRALKEGVADCFSGALMGAAYIFLNDIGSPLIICIEAKDIDHNLAVYWRNGKVGSLGASRQIELIGKPPQFDSYRQLVLSYYPDYYNDFTKDHSDITMRGISDPVDLRVFNYQWITSEENLNEIEEYLYSISYHKLFPERPELYVRPPIIDLGNNMYCCPRQPPAECINQ